MHEPGAGLARRGHPWRIVKCQLWRRAENAVRVREKDRARLRREPPGRGEPQVEDTFLQRGFRQRGAAAIVSDKARVRLEEIVGRKGRLADSKGDEERAEGRERRRGAPPLPPVQNV